MDPIQAKSDPGAARPSTAVVIPTYRRPSFLERVLRDLAEDRLPDELREVLVVENGRRDGTEEICGRYRGDLPVRYHFVPEPGKSNALNVALDLTEADFIVLYDDDVRVASGNLAAFVDGARRYGPGHFFGGPVQPEYAGEPPPDWIRPSLTTCVLGWSLGDEERPHDEFLGANWAAFRRDLLDAGGFVRGLGPNAEFRTVGQEVEMQERLLERGAQGIYLPGAVVRHHVPEHQCTLRWARKRRYQQHMSRILLAPRHRDAPSIAKIPRFLWRQSVTEILSVIAARLTGPRTRRRVRLEMKLAETIGQMAGYRRLRQGRGLVPPTGREG